jgi:hypothetical protein
MAAAKSQKTDVFDIGTVSQCWWTVITTTCAILLRVAAHVVQHIAWSGEIYIPELGEKRGGIS